MANGSPRERGKAKAQAEAEYLDREPALEAEHVMACSRVGPARGQTKVAPQVERPVLWNSARGCEGQAFLLAQDDFG